MIHEFVRINSYQVSFVLVAQLQPGIGIRYLAMILVYTVTAFEFAGIISAIVAIMSTRTAQGAIAWSVTLVTFPYLAVPLYWIFGRDKFQGYVLARQEQLEAVNRALAETTIELRRQAKEMGVDEGRLRIAERLARIPASANNRVELLIDGEATFASIFAGIDAAEHYILVQFYIIRNDELGREFKDRLIARAKEGVRVFLVYDEVGSFGLPAAYLDELRGAGVDVRHFNTRKGLLNRFQLNFRNHRKIVIVDGSTCWIGGHNVGDEYLGRNPKFGKWRDTHVKIEGPATLAAQVSFVEDWQWASDSFLPDLRWQPANVDGDCALLIAPSGPADDLETASLLHTHVINGACERLWIASPYFVPDQATVAALQLACLRGVDVRIIVPDKTDNLLVTLASYIYFQMIAPGGAKFFRYVDGFMHQKVFLIDDRIAGIGTANFDNRSFRLNFEISTLGSGPGYIAEVEKMFEADFERSKPMLPDAYTSRPFWLRFASRFSRLTSPIL